MKGEIKLWENLTDVAVVASARGAGIIRTDGKSSYVLLFDYNFGVEGNIIIDRVSPIKIVKLIYNEG